MENDNTTVRRYLPGFLWISALALIYITISAWILPFADGISLTSKIVFERLREIFGLLAVLLIGLTIIEVYFYQLFFRAPKNLSTAIFVRAMQTLLAILTIMLVISFFDLTDLIRLGDGAAGNFFRAPLESFTSLQNAMLKSKVWGKDTAGIATGGMVAAVILIIYVAIHFMCVPRYSRNGLAYLLIIPAFIGVFFLIIYPFLFEIKLAFSNASLGTQATKNAEYGLRFGWDNLVALFTGNVAKEAKFFDVFWRTILWTVINVSFHVSGGMALALLLNRPMKLKALYRTLLIVPWAIPTTIAAMSLRNEFDNRYGLFNILLGNVQAWLQSISVLTDKIFLLGPTFDWLAQTIGPVSWKQDALWAFVSVLIANIWLGIPFMSVIILGGLQSISQEYYEAAEIDGATKSQQFRHITIPLLRPVLTPAIVLGVVWTFNKFDIIYLITQGGPQEKTDILVSSMYKAAFQFYRYGFTAMFALVIFIVLFLFTLFYLRISNGLKSATD